MATNPLYDVTFDCADYDSTGKIGRGWIDFSTFDISADFVGLFITDPVIDLGDFSLDATFIVPAVISCDSIDLGDLILSADFYNEAAKNAWIKWSNIGEFDFNVDRRNVAGEMPLDWPGVVWAVMKLRGMVIVYGSGGVTQLTPKSNVFGMKTLSKVGLKSQWSITGNDYLQFFIDKRGRLCKMADVLEILGYEEFFASVTTPVMMFDEEKSLIYICDGVSGWVYSVVEESLGTGPAVLTGVGYATGVKYAVASAASLTYPIFEICTDIIDVGTRGNKTLHEFEVGTNLNTGELEVRVEYCLGLKGAWVNTPWKKVNPAGNINIPCFGKEFRIRMRATVAIVAEFDYMRLKGVVHNYSPIDL